METIIVMDSHHVCDKAIAKMFTSPPCKLMENYSRTLVLHRIKVQLILYKLFCLLGINHLHVFLAMTSPSFCWCFLTVHSLEKKGG